MFHFEEKKYRVMLSQLHLAYSVVDICFIARIECLALDSLSFHTSRQL